MDIPREQAWDDYETEEVHIRDKLQFELKSEFITHSETSCNQYTQEFYLFIPNALQINSTTYPKSQFYLDQTNLIRYKTPEFTFEELLNLNNGRSPLTRTLKLCAKKNGELAKNQISDELKLLGNVVRSTLRNETKGLMSLLTASGRTGDYSSFRSRTKMLCEHILKLHESYFYLQETFLTNWSDETFFRQFIYVKEFLSNAIIHYFTELLEKMRSHLDFHLKDVDDLLCEMIIAEERAKESVSNGKSATMYKSNVTDDENYLYRYGLLNKFVSDALTLSTNRFTLEQRYQHWIGGLSAGIAMLLYIALFIWLGNIFVINSAPFLLLTVVTYILKDRIKEWLKSFSYLQASRMFPDYTTIIQKLDGKKDLGLIKESFSFLAANQLSKELHNARKSPFHTVLETFQRPETILFYKRVVDIKSSPKRQGESRRNSFNIIFRFNIHKFLLKASDAIEKLLMLDAHSHKLVELRLPKVYHLNLIIVSTILNNGKPATKDLKKLRIIIDKNGIKRIEQLTNK